MSASDAPTCPRCGRHIPNDETPGAYPGAMSRTEGRREICSGCGLAEAAEQFTGRLTPEAEWPVVVPEEYYRVNSPSYWETVRATIDQERSETR